MVYVYIIQSLKSRRFYIGFSYDPVKRLKEHNRGMVKATRNKGPWRLVFTQKYPDKKTAQKIEYRLKALKRRDYIERIISEGFIKIKPD